MFALLLIVLRTGRVSREYWGVALWSVPPATVVVVVARVFGRCLARRPRIVRSIASFVAGTIIGIGWAVLSYYLSSGLVLAFDAPVLYCWSFGAILGLLVACFWPGMGQFARADA
jgi:hypothetical protein